MYIIISYYIEFQDVKYAKEILIYYGKAHQFFVRVDVKSKAHSTFQAAGLVTFFQESYPKKVTASQPIKLLHPARIARMYYSNRYRKPRFPPTPTPTTAWHTVLERAPPTIHPMCIPTCIYEYI